MAVHEDVASYYETEGQTMLEPSFRPASYDESVTRDPFGSSIARAPGTLDLSEWALLESVTQALDRDPILDVSDVDVEIEGRSVILIGTVPGLATKIRIENTVARIDGVAAIDNRLVVGRRP